MPNEPITNWAGKDGQYKRQVSSFRSHIVEGGEFPPEANRYHLYVSYACPWATRCLITRKLKGLESIISLSVVHPDMHELGWKFEASFPAATEDHLYGKKHLRELYFKANPDYQDRFTVPVLWDKKTETIVNNESAEIVRMFNEEFNNLLAPEFKNVDLYPQALRSQIDQVNEWVYDTINNGVYKSGFASTQEAYEQNVKVLFESMNRVESILAKQKYLVGTEMTEADLRLFVTLIRFDCTYVQHFKCDMGTIRHNYPYINKWLQDLYWNNDAYKASTDFEHIKRHYTKSHKQINPFSITPLGPIPNVEPLNDEKPKFVGFVQVPK